MSGEEVRKVEELVNSWIQQDHSLATHVVPLQEAKDKGKTAAALLTVPAVLTPLCLQCTSACMLLTDGLVQQEPSC